MAREWLLSTHPAAARTLPGVQLGAGEDERTR